MLRDMKNAYLNFRYVRSLTFAVSNNPQNLEDSYWIDTVWSAYSSSLDLCVFKLNAATLKTSFEKIPIFEKLSNHLML